MTENKTAKLEKKATEEINEFFLNLKAYYAHHGYHVVFGFTSDGVLLVKLEKID